jgi:hypothetical protein
MQRLPFWYLVAIVLPVLLWFTASDYGFGISWPLYSLYFFDIRILITFLYHWPLYCKQVNVLRRLKFTLSKQALSNTSIYLTFIRPVLEYACEVWDGCFERDIEKIEKIQLEAARIATGLTNLLVRIHYILRLDGKL